MKRETRFLSLGALAAVAFAALPQASVAQDYVGATLAANPLAYWRFESANDTSLVNGYTGSYQGTATNTAPGGGAPLFGYPNNEGLALDGGGYDATSLQTSFSTGGTMMAWINMAELPSVANRYFYIAGESTNGNDFDLQVQNDNKLYFYTDSGASTVDPTALTANTWINVAVTLDNVNHVRSMYVDGQLVAQNTNVGTHGASTNTFNIGESNVFTGRFFDGAIDEVAVWNSALTGSQIQTIYDASATPEPASVVLLLGGIGFLARRRSTRLKK